MPYDPSPCSRRLRPLALLAPLLLVAGCSNGSTAVPVEGAFGNETVRGKVTYKGEPVPYGYVLFFNHASLDPTTGMRRPVAFGMITPEGTYEAANVPAGPVMIAIATDPSADPISLTQPQAMGGPPVGAMGETGPGGPGPGGPGPGGPPGGMPPGGGPMQGFGPGAPPLPGPGEGGPDQLPGGAPELKVPSGTPRPPSAPVASPAGLLPPEKQRRLREIHERYSALERANLTYEVKEGEQTFNIALK